MLPKCKDAPRNAPHIRKSPNNPRQRRPTRRNAAGIRIIVTQEPFPPKDDSASRPDSAAHGAESASSKAPGRTISEKQRNELWMYLAVSIVAVELLVTVGALCYGFIASAASAPGEYAFPWLSWGAVSLLAPACILLAVHLADVGLFTHKANADSEWQENLPERLRRLYRFIKGAPAIVVLLLVVGLGAALLTLEGALSALRSLGSALLPHLPWIIGGAAAVVCVIALCAVWLSYRTRRLLAEYEFRREIFEKTGVIIVDKGSTPLPPGGAGPMPYALSGPGGKPLPALEAGTVIEAEVEQTYEAKPSEGAKNPEGALPPQTPPQGTFVP